MEINRKSWHWRLNCAYYSTISDESSSFKYYLESERYDYILSNYIGNTLCSYFWKTIFNLVRIVLVLILVYLLSGALTFALVIGPIFAAITQFQAGYFEFVPEYAAWTVILTMGLIGVLIYASSKAEFEGLVPEYIKARKNKFCPTLTVRK